MLEELQYLASHLETPRPGPDGIQIQGVCPPARALVTSFLAQKNPRPMLCVAPDWREAERFAEELGFFTSLFRYADGTDKNGFRVLLFPPGLPRPVGLARPSVTSMHERMGVLLALLEPELPPVVITAIEAFRERVPPKEALMANILEVREGQSLDRDGLASFLDEVGYRRVPVVEAPGEFAVRGSLIDFHPLLEREPLRVDFFGDLVEGIRTFSAESQRSSGTVSSATIHPAGPFIGRAIELEGLRRHVKERADALNLPTRNRMEFLARVEAGLPAYDLPLYLPFFYPRLHSLLDYFGNDGLLVLLDPDRFRRVEEALEKECAESVDKLTTKGTIIPSLQDLFVPLSTLWGEGHPMARLSFSDLPAGPLLADTQGSSPAQTQGPARETANGRPAVIRLRSRSIASYATPAEGVAMPRGLSSFVGLIRKWVEEGQKVFLVCRSESEKARMSRLLLEYEIDFSQPGEKLPFWGDTPALHLIKGELSQGFAIPSGGLVFLHEEDIFGRKVRKHRLRVPEPLDSLAPHELEPEEYVVHIDFGIGLYRGLETLDIRGYVNDYLHLEYAKGDKLYLPVDRASRIQKYVSTEDLPPTLDRLGSPSWTRTKQKVKESVLAMAEELVSLYATRLVRKGLSFSKSDPSYHEFEASFPYEETQDQVRAIEEVLRDMEGERPMDRLVCGDVGFGKTEVAIRAAYKAVMDGKQVAVLVPTTVLAQQHYTNFLKRFEDYPVEIEMLSRFRSPKQQKAILAAMVDGKADIVVGTHRLLQKDVKFRDLGLLILDEEHRFGVRHKEALKKMRTEVDVLTLSATPIPRTLQMSLLGLRDLSSIKTPPQDRRAIETYIIPFEQDIIRHAVVREIERGGQVFFVHNQVYDIETFAARLEEIVPKASIAVAHGQMPERSLERVMLDFVQGKYTVLVCTTIIESGLDIPNANTLLVHRADRLGLAQLYQLRGRVGRSERQAYTYLIVPDEDTLAGEARKRLEALYEFTELGSGFRIARYDLEIRGAGNLLGAHQSGHVRAIGYDLYMEMLEKAIRQLKGETTLEEVDPEIHLEMPAHLPQEYIEDSTQRLSFYKRLAKTRDDHEVDQIRVEMQDRFGTLPAQAETLLDLIRIKVRLRRLRVREARLAEEGLMLSFDPQPSVSVDRILAWSKQEPDRLRLFPDDRVLIRFFVPDPRERLVSIRQILDWLEKEPSQQRVGHGEIG
jgi:transcription-repair coupling factor (superfamily II helicase)